MKNNSNENFFNIIESNTLKQEISYDPFEEEAEKQTEERLIFEEKIFTDGTIDKVIEEISKNISNYKDSFINYDDSHLNLYTKKYCIKNARYIIVMNIQNKLINNGICGWFKIINNIQVFINNKKDKEALKKAHKVIKDIKESQIYKHSEFVKVKVKKLNKKITYKVS